MSHVTKAVLRWFSLCTIHILLFSFTDIQPRVANADENVELKISNSVASHVCGQQGKYQESNRIQNPVQNRPEIDHAECGWLLWTKSESECDSTSGSSCSSFTFEPCGEEKGVKMGRNLKPLQDQEGREEQAEEEKCPKRVVFPGLEIASPPNKYPQLVAIHRGIGCYRKACWGGIVNEEWVVVPQTSGCFSAFVPNQPEDFHIIAGDKQIYKDEGTEQVRKVAEFIPHPDFNFEEYKFYSANLGLIRLDEPFQFNEHVQPINWTAVKEISTSSSSSPESLSNLKVASWLPNIKSDELNQTSLIELPVDFVPDSDCFSKAMEEDGAVKESLICAGKCIVSGNVLDPGLKHGLLFTFVQNPNSKDEPIPVPIGLGPINHADAGKNSLFGVFTDLSFYLPWIEETVGSGGGGGGQSKGEVKGQGHGQDENSRLVGSSDSPPHKYPASVNIKTSTNSHCYQYNCGGAILSPNWIITAAHCAEYATHENQEIVAGDHDLSQMESSEQLVKIERVILHENFNYTDSLINDVALLKISPPLKFNDNVKAVQLPEQDFQTQGVGQAVGWGLHNGYIPHILQEVQMPIIPIDECIKIAQELNFPSVPHKEENICAGANGISTCKGDSGSPLYLVDEESGAQTIIGLVSFGTPNICNEWKYLGRRAKGEGETVRPSVYVNLSHYIHWIRKHMEEMEDE